MAEARASLDFRLVPDQRPERVRERVEAHLRAQGWHVTAAEPDAATRRAHPKVVRVQWEAGYPAFRTPMDLPASRAVARVLDEARGRRVVRVPHLGGSVPMSIFDDVLKTPIIGVPVANHDNNQHAADENIRLANLWDAIEIYAALVSRLGHAWAAPAMP
jgi:acetylornithine deacetylase/succinyl-diaminopimelate desuccinylase-like protein